VAFFAVAHLNNLITTLSYSNPEGGGTRFPKTTVFTKCHNLQDHNLEDMCIYACTLHLPNLLHPLRESLCKFKLGTVFGAALDLFLGYGLFDNAFSIEIVEWLMYDELESI
jgi:hypothetical protein